MASGPDDWVVPGDDWVVPQEAASPWGQQFGEMPVAEPVAPGAKTTMGAAGTAFAVSAATLPEQAKNYLYGQRLADYNRQIAELDQPTFEAEGITYADPTTQQQRAAKRKELEVAREEWRQKYGKNVEALNVAEQLMKEARPEDATILDDAFISFAGSAPQLLGTIATGMTFGVPAAAVAGGAAGMSTQAGQTTKEIFDKQGIGATDASPAVLAGVAEGVGEAIGVKGLFNQNKNLLVRAAVALGYEGTQEGVTQFLQDVVAKTSYDPKLTWQEMGRNAAVAFLAGTFGGAAAKGVLETGQALQPSPEQRLESALERAARLDMEASLAGRPSPEAIARGVLTPEQPLPVPPLTMPEQQAAAPSDWTIPQPEGVVPPAEATILPEQGPATGAFAPTQPYMGGEVVQTAPIPEGLVEAIIVSPETAAQVALEQSPLETGINPLVGAQQALAQGFISEQQFNSFKRELSKLLDERLTESEQQFDELTDEFDRLEKKLTAYQAQPPMPLLPYEQEQLTAAEEVQAGIEQARATFAQGAPQSEVEKQLVAVRAKAKQAGGVVSALGKMTGVLTLDNVAEGLRVYTNALKQRAQNATALWGQPGINLATLPEFRVPRVLKLRQAWTTSKTHKGASQVALQDLEPGSVTTGSDLGVASTSVLTPEQSEILKTVGRVVRRWVDAQGMQETPIVIQAYPSGVASAAVSDLGGGKWAFVINLGPRVFEVYKNKPAFWKIIAHETGHLVVTRMLMEASPQMQRALLRAWQEDERRTLGLDEMKQELRRRGPGEFSSLTGATAKLAGEMMTGMPEADATTAYLTYGMVGYITSFTEWVAHKSEQMLTGDRAMQKIVLEETREKGVLPFLRGAIRKLRQLAKSYSESTKVPEPFEDFVKGMARYFEAKRADAQRIQRTREKEFVETGMGTAPPVVPARAPQPVPMGVPVQGQQRVYSVERTNGARIAELERLVDEAYARGDPRAEDLDAELAALRELEDEGIAEPDQTDYSTLEEHLLEGYAAWLAGGGKFGDKAAAVTFMRAAVEYFGGKVENDQQVLDAAADLYMSRLARQDRRLRSVPKPFQALQAMDDLWRKSGLRDTKRQGSFSQELDKFNQAKRWLQSLLEIAKANRHITELYNPNGTVWPDGRTRYGYLDYVYKWNRSRMEWIARADERMKQMRKAIGWSKKKGDALRRLLFDQVLAGHYFDLTDPAIQAKYPLTPELLELYQGIKSDFEDINKEMEEILVQETLWRKRNNPFVGQLVQKIRQDFAKMREVPYFPFSRFGKFANVIYKMENGKQVMVGFETYDLRAQRKLAAAALRRKGLIVNERNTSDEMMPFVGLRPEVLDNLKGNLQLTPEQEKALDEYILQRSPAQSARKHFMKRKKTPGWSQDTTRAYADYFMKMAGLVARLKYQTPMNEVLTRLEETARDVSAPDTTKRQAIADYMRRHYNYIMNPTNEWQGLRAVTSIATLGVVVSSAVTNLFQVPIFTLPWLETRYGAKAIPALVKAYKSLPRTYGAGHPMRKETADAYDKWVTGQPMTEKEQKLVDRYFKVDEKVRDALAWGISEGILDQSFAMELAAMSEGSWLNKFQATSEAGYRARQLLRGVMIPFELAEKINRRVTFIAAFELGLQAGMTEEQARIHAREAVQETQFEYSKWARPELLRDKKGALFMFWNYQLSALTHLMGGDKSWWKSLAIMLLLAGPAGLPFADDILDFLTWLLSSENKRVDAKVEMEKGAQFLAETLIGSPDLYMHGGLGMLPIADFAGPLSLGDIIPATELLSREGTFSEKFLMGAKDAGGLMTSLALNAARALTDDTLPLDRRIELGMPVRFVRNILAAERWINREAVETLSGDDIIALDLNNPKDIALVAAKLGGWQPKELAKEQRMTAARQDMVKFYQARRQILLAAFDRALESDDPTKVMDVMDAISKYNEDVPNPLLGISGRQIAESRRQRAKQRAKGEAGVGRTRVEKGVRMELED